MARELFGCNIVFMQRLNRINLLAAPPGLTKTQRKNFFYCQMDALAMGIAMGVASMLFWHVAINLGMVLGLLPVVGVTLPLFSYGGTSVLTNLIGVGLLLSISARRLGPVWET